MASDIGEPINLGFVAAGQHQPAGRHRRAHRRRQAQAPLRPGCAARRARPQLRQHAHLARLGWEPSISLERAREDLSMDLRPDARPARAPAAARGRLGGPVSDGRGEVPFFRPDIGQKEMVKSSPRSRSGLADERTARPPGSRRRSHPPLGPRTRWPSTRAQPRSPSPVGPPWGFSRETACSCQQ